MAKRQIAKQILGTVVAVLSGWLAAMIFLEATTVVELMQERHYVVPDALYVAPITITIIMSYFVIPVWLFVLIPLYLFVPPSSVLWRLPVCTTCGVLAGILIIAFWMPGFQASVVSLSKPGGSTLLLRSSVASRVLSAP
jgi:hypothetical protein